MNIIPRRVDKEIGGILVSAFINEHHSRKTTSTEYPVEDGSTISDHIRIEPDEFTAEGIMSPAGVIPITALYDQLNALVDAKVPVDVVSGLKVYTSMQIMSFDVNREAMNGGSLPFTMVFKKIKTVKSQTVAVPKSSLSGTSATQRQAQAPVNAGKVTGVTK